MCFCFLAILKDAKILLCARTILPFSRPWSCSNVSALCKMFWNYVYPPLSCAFLLLRMPKVICKIISRIHDLLFLLNFWQIFVVPLINFRIFVSFHSFFIFVFVFNNMTSFDNWYLNVCKENLNSKRIIFKINLISFVMSVEKSVIL